MSFNLYDATDVPADASARPVPVIVVPYMLCSTADGTAWWRECMEAGIAAAKPWHFVGDIGAACGAHAHENGYGVVTDLGGHGVGKGYHLEPFVSHDATAGTGMLLVPGMTLTVEPMINEGTWKTYTDKTGDGWTVRTKDHKLSAQWEKTILITETGSEVLSS